jgi:hypothetical protein
MMAATVRFRVAPQPFGRIEKMTDHEKGIEACPFCGEPTTAEIEDNGSGCFWVICDNVKDGCGCEGPYKHSEEDAIAAWNRRAATSKPVAEAVKVKPQCTIKPLEWEEGAPGTYKQIAESPFGHYSVWEINGTACWSPWKSGSGAIVDGGLVEAKAAAQADYEQRIMSALSTPPQPEAQGEPVAWWIVGSSAVTTDKDVTDRWRLGNPDSNVVRLYASPPQPEFAAALKRIADETTIGEPFKNENRIMSRDDMIEHARAALGNGGETE